MTVKHPEGWLWALVSRYQQTMGMFLCRCHCCSVPATSTSHDSQPETRAQASGSQTWGTDHRRSAGTISRYGISQASGSSEIREDEVKGGLRINPGLYLSILGVYLVLQPAKYLALLQHYLFWEIPQPDFIWNCEKCEVFVCQRLQPCGYYGGFQSKSIRLLSEDSCVKSIKAGLLTS